MPGDTRKLLEGFQKLGQPKERPTAGLHRKSYDGNKLVHHRQNLEAVSRMPLLQRGRARVSAESRRAAVRQYHPIPQCPAVQPLPLRFRTRDSKPRKRCLAGKTNG